MSISSNMYQNHDALQNNRKPDICTVFWDYENCPCPMHVKVPNLVKHIKQEIETCLQCPVQKEIILYCPADRIHHKTREDFMDCGVKVMDVPTKRKMESVDKRIIADMALYAADLAQRSQKGAMCLISGDSDFGYVLSRLHDRPQITSIILITKTTHIRDSLRAHADFIIHMFDELQPMENPFSWQNQHRIAKSPVQYTSTGSLSQIYSYRGSRNNQNNQNNQNQNQNQNNNGDRKQHLQVDDGGSASDRYFPYHPQSQSRNNHNQNRGRTGGSSTNVLHQFDETDSNYHSSFRSKSLPRSHQDDSMSSPNRKQQANGVATTGASTGDNSSSPEKKYGLAQVNRSPKKHATRNSQTPKIAPRSATLQSKNNKQRHWRKSNAPPETQRTPSGVLITVEKGDVDDDITPPVSPPPDLGTAATANTSSGSSTKMAVGYTTQQDLERMMRNQQKASLKKEHVSVSNGKIANGNHTVNGATNGTANGVSNQYNKAKEMAHSSLQFFYDQPTRNASAPPTTNRGHPAANREEKPVLDTASSKPIKPNKSANDKPTSPLVPASIIFDAKEGSTIQLDDMSVSLDNLGNTADPSYYDEFFEKKILSQIDILSTTATSQFDGLLPDIKAIMGKTNGSLPPKHTTAHSVSPVKPKQKNHTPNGILRHSKSGPSLSQQETGHSHSNSLDTGIANQTKKPAAAPPPQRATSESTRNGKKPMSVEEKSQRAKDAQVRIQLVMQALTNLAEKGKEQPRRQELINHIRDNFPSTKDSKLRAGDSWIDKSVGLAITYGFAEELYPGRISKASLALFLGKFFMTHKVNTYYNLSTISNYLSNKFLASANLFAPRYLFNVAMGCKAKFVLHKEDIALAKKCRSQTSDDYIHLRFKFKSKK